MTEETKRVLKAYKKLDEIEDAVGEMSFDIDNDTDDYLPQHAKHILELANELVKILAAPEVIEVETTEHEKQEL